MRKLLVPLALLLTAATCPPNPTPTPTPTPVPTPTPTPTPGPLFMDLLLRQLDPPHLTRNGQQYNAFGAIQCCVLFVTPTADASGSAVLIARATRATPRTRLKLRRPAQFRVNGVPQNSRWPLFSESWVDFTKANMFHARMGPFYGDADHESEWADIGGPYAGGPGSDWNPAFWTKVNELVAYAGSKQANVEVNVIDTWYCKHAQWGDQPMPWPQTDINACGRQSSQEQERYIRKVVSELGKYANVVWLTDNEGGEIQGTTKFWYEWVRTIIREEEQRTGFGVVHLVGSNNLTWCGSGPFDYCATHENAALSGPENGKHKENNERNGQPQNSPELEHNRFCDARSKGLHYWFWRAEMTDDQLYRSMVLFQSGCGGPQQCFAPDANDPMWGTNVVGPTDRRDEVNAAKVVVGEQCGSVPPHEGAFPTLAALAQELRSRGLCASGPWGDALAVQEGSDPRKWSEWHACRFTDGCWADNPAVLPKFIWTYNGPPPNPPTTCTNPDPIPLTSWNVKEHTKGPDWTTLDSTPLVGPDVAYCASIGFTDGRARCPVRVEGDPKRPVCEAQIVGTPVWTAPPGWQPHPTGNPYMIRVPRGVTGEAKVCGKGGVCGTVMVTP